jgi:hypothetical protein
VIDLFQGAVFFVSKKEKKKRGDTISIDDSIFVRKGVSTPRVVLRGDEKARERVVARARAKPSPALLLLSRKKKKKKKKRERKTNTIKKEKFKIPNFSHK